MRRRPSPFYLNLQTDNFCLFVRRQTTDKRPTSILLEEQMENSLGKIVWVSVFCFSFCCQCETAEGSLYLHMHLVCIRAGGPRTNAERTSVYF
jgi:hypothetical protein